LSRRKLTEKTREEKREETPSPPSYVEVGAADREQEKKNPCKQSNGSSEVAPD